MNQVYFRIMPASKNFGDDRTTRFNLGFNNSPVGREPTDGRTNRRTEEFGKEVKDGE